MILQSASGLEVKTARKSVMPTQKSAAKVCGLGMNAYVKRENCQDLFKIKELKLLYDACGNDGKDTIAAFLAKNFPAVVNLK